MGSARGGRLYDAVVVFIAVMAGGFVAMATGVAYARWWRREDDPSHLAEMFQDIDPEIPGG